jgi:hypothetical protein
MMHRRGSGLLSLGALFAATACTSPDPASPASAGTGGAGGGATTGASATSSSTGVPFEPGGEVTTFEGSFGPLLVAPGVEETRCVLVRLGNHAAAFARRFRTELRDGSHHFIVYRSDETVEDHDAKPCAGFSGFTTGEAPIFIAQHGDAELVFPTHEGTPVGLAIAPEQMLRIEMHYLNATSEPLEVQGTASIDTIASGSDLIESDLAFWGTTHLNAGGDPPADVIPTGATGDTGVIFQPALAGTWSFALTTHQHWLGTRMRVWYAEGPSGLPSPLADCSDWSAPPLVKLDPPLEFPDDGADGKSSKGLAYRCEWDNVTAEPVGYGESAATAEMCFLWHYYYPSSGLHYCLDGDC